MLNCSHSSQLNLRILPPMIIRPWYRPRLLWLGWLPFLFLLWVWGSSKGTGRWITWRPEKTLLVEAGIVGGIVEVRIGHGLSSWDPPHGTLAIEHLKIPPPPSPEALEHMKDPNTWSVWDAYVDRYGTDFGHRLFPRAVGWYRTYEDPFLPILGRSSGPGDRHLGVALWFIALLYAASWTLASNWWQRRQRRMTAKTSASMGIWGCDLSSASACRAWSF
jgi:hypothetical protein